MAEVVRVLLSVASRRALVVVIDDLHAADPATQQLLHVLSRRLTGHPCAVVASYRAEELTAGSALRQLVTSLRREAGADELTLGGLPDGVQELVVGQRFGPQPVDRSLLRTIVRAAEGNPLFAGELVATLVEDGSARLLDGRWQARDLTATPVPMAARELLERRLQRLDEPSRRLLAVAAVLGADLDHRTLQRALGVPEDTVLDALDRTIAAGILVETGEGYSFGHDLLRAAAYHRLNLARRHRLHGIVADALAGASPATVAYHLIRGSEPWRAVAPLRDAARQATAVFANAAARDRYAQAIALARRHPDRVDRATFAALLEELGDLAIRTGDACTGAAHLQEALAVRIDLGDEQAVLRVRGLAALGHVVGGNVAAAVELLGDHLAAWERVLTEQAGPELAALGPAAALHMLADIRWHGGDHRAALAAAEQAVRSAEEAGDLRERARAYESMALACHSLGDWERGLEYELQRGRLGLPGFTDVALDAHY